MVAYVLLSSFRLIQSAFVDMENMLALLTEQIEVGIMGYFRIYGIASV